MRPLSIFVFLFVVSTALSQQRAGEIGQYVAFSLDVLGAPKARDVRTPGFSVTVFARKPKGDNGYYVSLFVKSRKKNADAWQYVKASKTPIGQVYTSKNGYATDWVFVEGKEAVSVPLFLPHQTLDLRDGDYDLQFEVRLLDSQRKEYARQALWSVEVAVEKAAGSIRRRVIEVTPDPIPAQIWDIDGKKWLESSKGNGV